MEPTPAMPRIAGRRCDQCGGQVAFKPGHDALECRFCGRLDDIVVPRLIVEHDYATARTTAPTGPASEVAMGGREVACTQCGARVVTCAQATRCAFCDAALVVEIPEERRQILPESVLPFRIEAAAATATMQKWIRSRWFAPSDLVKRARTRPVDGVYLPYWTYDSQTQTSYLGQRGEHYTVTERRNGKDHQVRHTRWRPAFGNVRVGFDDVLVCGSRSVPRPALEALEPWDLHDLRAFDDRYLAGFSAERYAIDVHDGFSVADARMQAEIRRAIRRDIGGDDQRILATDVRHDHTRFKHVLLPLWIAAYRYQGRVFRLTINARTGGIRGERPWSWPKLVAFFSFLIALTVAAVLLYRHYRPAPPPPPEPEPPALTFSAASCAPTGSAPWSPRPAPAGSARSDSRGC